MKGKKAHPSSSSFPRCPDCGAVMAYHVWMRGRFYHCRKCGKETEV